MIEETGVDGVMIARAAKDYPFIFKQCNDYLETGSYNEKISLTNMVKEVQNFYHDLSLIKGPIIAFKEIKGIAANWLSKYTGIKEEKNLIVRSQDLEEFNKRLNLLIK